MMRTGNAPKKATSLSLDTALIAEAKQLGIGLSAAAEAGLRSAINDAKAFAWQSENAEALESSNEWIEQHGLPLAPHRQF